MPAARRRVDWARWLRRWDAQQEGFFPERELRFRAMLDLLEAELGSTFHVLDLGSGPGSLSARILRRFPSARVTAVDYDPVLIKVGQGALGSVGGRLDWIEAKLGDRGWRGRLPRKRYDGAVSTTALHWLAVPELSTLYADLGDLVRRGGVVLNGDHLPWGSKARGLARVGSRVRELRSSRPRPGPRSETWRTWWAGARRLPELRSAFEEHDRRFDPRFRLRPPRAKVSLDVHLRELQRAGFRTIATVWQDFENRVVFARR